MLHELDCRGMYLDMALVNMLVVSNKCGAPCFYVDPINPSLGNRPWHNRY
jgi:hypothetical protein